MYTVLISSFSADDEHFNEETSDPKNPLLIEIPETKRMINNYSPYLDSTV